MDHSNVRTVSESEHFTVITGTKESLIGTHYFLLRKSDGLPLAVVSDTEPKRLNALIELMAGDGKAARGVKKLTQRLVTA